MYRGGEGALSYRYSRRYRGFQVGCRDVFAAILTERLGTCGTEEVCVLYLMR